MKHKKKHKKIDWELVGGIALIIILIVILIVCIAIRIWVFSEYGDMPITEVPAWAIPWLGVGR